MAYKRRSTTRLTWSIPCCGLFPMTAELCANGLSHIGAMTPAKLSLSMVASPHSPLRFHLVMHCNSVRAQYGSLLAMKPSELSSVFQLPIPNRMTFAFPSGRSADLVVSHNQSL